MKYRIHLVVIMIVLVALNGCARLVVINNQSNNLDQPNHRLGKMTVPIYKVQDFRSAENRLMELINSQDFENQFKHYAKIHQQQSGERYEESWKNIESDRVLKLLRDSLPGLNVDTYGGPIGFLKYVFAGNLAYDGNLGEPIRMNRTKMRSRSVAELCNTIVHETSHRVGLEHPNSNSDFSATLCEPPYVIGSIMEKQVAGNSWEYSTHHCKHMKP